jgi:hypothetical protein
MGAAAPPLFEVSATPPAASDFSNFYIEIFHF